MLRELRQLASSGWEVGRYSISPPDRPLEKLSPEEREEASQTRWVKQASFGQILAAHTATLLSRPGPYLSTLFGALRLGHLTPAALLRRVYYFAEAVILGHWLTQAGYTHIHSHYAPMVALLLSRVFPITFSMTVHGPDEFLDPKGGALADKIAGSLLSVAISNFARSQMMMHSSPPHWAKIEKCYLGVPDPLPPSSAERKPGPARFLCVGRLAPVKGQHILVEAALRLAASGLDFSLTIAGGGPELAFLRDRVQSLNLGDRVSLPGFVSQEELERLYRETDVFVLPSFAEGVPGVLMEAMRDGKPCISTYVNGVPELIEHERSGLLVTPADEAALASAMRRLVEDPALRHRLGEAGRDRVAQEFNLRKNVEKLAALFTGRLEKTFDS